MPAYDVANSDSGHEVRFSVELTRLKGLSGTYSVDIRRMKGQLWAYKSIYHQILDALPLKSDFL